jgi:plasmid stabilization system protein ParE
MESYIFAPEAVEDLQNIWDFLSLDSVPAADRQIEGLLEAFEQLGRWPGKGHRRADMGDRPVRFWPEGSYLIVYREESSPLQIVAILHGARDVPSVIRDR